MGNCRRSNLVTMYEAIGQRMRLQTDLLKNKEKKKVANVKLESFMIFFDKMLIQTKTNPKLDRSLFQERSYIKCKNTAACDPPHSLSCICHCTAVILSSPSLLPNSKFGQTDATHDISSLVRSFISTATSRHRCSRARE